MKDYQWCKAIGCDKSKGCRRAITNHILEFIPMKFIEYHSCIESGYGMLDRYRNDDGTSIENKK